MDCRKNPSNNLIFCRLRAGLTQQQLAERTGWTVMHISDLETSRKSLGEISLRNAIKLAEALELDDIRELTRGDREIEEDEDGE